MAGTKGPRSHVLSSSENCVWSDVAGIQDMWGQARVAEVRIYRVQGGWGVWMRNVTEPTQAGSGQIHDGCFEPCHRPYALDPRQLLTIFHLKSNMTKYIFEESST